jgi:hypothetical protein
MPIEDTVDQKIFEIRTITVPPQPVLMISVDGSYHIDTSHLSWSRVLKFASGWCLVPVLAILSKVLKRSASIW